LSTFSVCLCCTVQILPVVPSRTVSSYSREAVCCKPIAAKSAEGRLIPQIHSYQVIASTQYPTDITSNHILSFSPLVVSGCTYCRYGVRNMRVGWRPGSSSTFSMPYVGCHFSLPTVCLGVFVAHAFFVLAPKHQT
jgi:hypothetical protein